jgi:hypothetical protein
MDVHFVLDHPKFEKKAPRDDLLRIRKRANPSGGGTSYAVCAHFVEPVGHLYTYAIPFGTIEFGRQECRSILRQITNSQKTFPNGNQRVNCLKNKYSRVSTTT